MVGPVLQQDLFSIIARFRTFKYALIADIAKMYRQVLVDETQVALQRIIWQDHKDEEIKDYELLTVTYGRGPASFLVIKCLRTLTEIESTNFPIGSQILRRDFYVDDLITGSNSRIHASQIRDEVTKLLEKGGFVLRKWALNNSQLLNDIPEAYTASSVRSLDKGDSFKTLGIQWNPTDDFFQYKIMTTTALPQRTTKRTILSCIAQIFDPLGLLGPVIVSAKILIQKLWSLQLNWDESLPIELYTQWNAYKSQIQRLNELRIPRRVIESEEVNHIEIHGFCDASQDAYGACVYIRTSDMNGIHHACLLCSKSRVAPMKTVSLPRLELCGAQLLAQLIDKVVPILNLQIQSIYCWTDATIVIDWIRSSSRKFNTFVANRIGEIQELTNIESWHHVSTNENPADILSRGTSAETLMESSLWWSGPQWLINDKALWPKTVRPLSNPDQLLEQKTLVVAVAAQEEGCDMINEFSSYNRLVKITAMCLRFKHNAQSKLDQRTSGPVSARELETARAHRELEELRNFFTHEEVRHRIINETAPEAITWQFIPPQAPHFGGLWEASVKSMKHHFSRVASDSALTFEEVTTLLTQIEAKLNSQPLTPLSSDPEDCSYPTPGHFLIGDSLISYPEPKLQHVPINRLTRWQRIEQIRQHFWKRWSVDYLHQLQQRTKWKKDEGPTLQLGQLVIIRENNLPPQSWLIGRVIAVHPGADEIVRTASVKTSRGIVKRPAKKLCILPIET